MILLNDAEQRTISRLLDGLISKRADEWDLLQRLRQECDHYFVVYPHLPDEQHCVHCGEITAKAAT